MLAKFSLDSITQRLQNRRNVYPGKSSFCSRIPRNYNSDFCSCRDEKYKGGKINVNVLKQSTENSRPFRFSLVDQ